jgi:hypothetical protein
MTVKENLLPGKVIMSSVIIKMHTKNLKLLSKNLKEDHFRMKIQSILNFIKILKNILNNEYGIV